MKSPDSFSNRIKDLKAEAAKEAASTDIDESGEKDEPLKFDWSDIEQLANSVQEEGEKEIFARIDSSEIRNKDAAKNVTRLALLDYKKRFLEEAKKKMQELDEVADSFCREIAPFVEYFLPEEVDQSGRIQSQGSLEVFKLIYEQLFVDVNNPHPSLESNGSSLRDQTESDQNPEIRNQPEDTYKKYFGSPEKSNLSQQNTGNCYLVAALNSLSNSPDFGRIISSSFREVDGAWEVKIPLGPGEGKIVKISQRDLLPIFNIDYGQSSSLMKHGMKSSHDGFKILEAAYSKYLFGKVDRLNSASGDGQEALRVLLGDDYIDRITIAEHTFPTKNKGIRRIGISLSEQFADCDEEVKARVIEFLDGFDNNCLVTVGTPNKANDTMSFNVGKNKIYYKHAYSVESTDKENQTVTIVNPWDTSKKIVLSYEEFMQAFSKISGVRIRREKLDQLME